MFQHPYTPDDKAPWNLRRVVHLHRRASLAATWEELRRDLADGPHKAIDRLLTAGPFEPLPLWSAPPG